MNRQQFLRLSALGSGTLISGLPGTAQADGEGAATLFPYLQTPQPDSIWVNWWTNLGTESFVDWGTSPTELTNTASGSMQNKGTGYHYHSAKITGLQPSTYYYYCIRSNGEFSDVYRFRTQPAKGTSTGHFRVLVMGDNQILTGERRWERLIKLAKAKIETKYGAPMEETIDLMLNIGDQVDVGTLNHWRNLHFDYGKTVTPYIPSMTTVGNHETYSGDADLALYKSLFAYDELDYGGVTNPGGKVYYAYQLANILFVHTNSEALANQNETSGAVQKKWVQDLVNVAKDDPSVEFIISLVHRPYQAEQYIGDISAWFRNEIMPILCQTKKHVLNLGAHHHLYARGQTRDWPTYHIINGASAWDQFWGQSTERDFDDVQKTIANWAWQIIDFDLDQRKMSVECFAEANVRFSQAERWTTKAYNSRLIDSFHRQFGIPLPNAPTIINGNSGEPGKPNVVTLPLTLRSSPFSTESEEAFNSSQFQIAADPEFVSLRVDRIRDVENLYGDTGAPNYEPTNINANVNILEHTIAEGALPSSTFYARVRHRDTNAEWSEWSPLYEFSVTGSTTADPGLKLSKSVFPPEEDITIAYERIPAKTADWIGIFPSSQNPADAPATTRQYVTDGAGTRTFRYNLPEGLWFAGLFANDTTNELAPRVPFYVGSAPAVAVSQSSFDEGAAVTASWSGARGSAGDRIAIFRAGESALTATPVAIANATTPAGSQTFPDLANGYYFAVFLPEGGTFELGNRAGFSIGATIASVSMTSTTVNRAGGVTENFQVNFSGGPGIPKDWIGLYAADSTPGIGELIQYLYFEGATTGSVTFALPDLPPGDYFVAMFTNDSYTEVSNRFLFSVTSN